MSAKDISTMSRTDFFYRISRFQDIWENYLGGGSKGPPLTLRGLKGYVKTCETYLQGKIKILKTSPLSVLRKIVQNEL